MAEAISIDKLRPGGFYHRIGDAAKYLAELIFAKSQPLTCVAFYLFIKQLPSPLF